MTDAIHSDVPTDPDLFWTLRMLQGPQAGASVTLPAGTYWFGTDSARCDVALVLPRTVPASLFGSLEVKPEGLHIVICTDTPRLILLDSQSGERRVLRNGEGVHIAQDHRLQVEDASSPAQPTAGHTTGLGASPVLAMLQLSPQNAQAVQSAESQADESSTPALIDVIPDPSISATADIQDAAVKAPSTASTAVSAAKVKSELAMAPAQTGPWWLSNTRRAAKARAIAGLMVLLVLVVFSFKSKWFNEILPAGFKNPPGPAPAPNPQPSTPGPNPAIEWKRKLPEWAQELRVVTLSPATGQYPAMYALTGTVETNAQLDTLLSRLSKDRPEVRLHVLSLETFAAQLAGGGDIPASAVRQSRSGMFELTVEAPAYRKSRTQLRRAIEQEPQVESLIVRVLLTPVPRGVQPEIQQVTLARNAQSGDVVVTGETPVLTEPDVKTPVDIVYIRPGPVPSVRLGNGDIVFEGATLGKGLTLHTIEANRVLVRQAATGRLVEILPPQRAPSQTEESAPVSQRYRPQKQ